MKKTQVKANYHDKTEEGSLYWYDPVSEEVYMLVRQLGNDSDGCTSGLYWYTVVSIESHGIRTLSTLYTDKGRAVAGLVPFYGTIEITVSR